MLMPWWTASQRMNFRWEGSGIWGPWIWFLSPLVDAIKTQCKKESKDVTRRDDSTVGLMQLKQTCISPKWRCIRPVWRLEPMTSNPSRAVAPKPCICTSWLSPAVQSLSQLIANVMTMNNVATQILQLLNWPDSFSGLFAGGVGPSKSVAGLTKCGSWEGGCACIVDLGNLGDP